MPRNVFARPSPSQLMLNGGFNSASEVVAAELDWLKEQLQLQQEQDHYDDSGYVCERPKKKVTIAEDHNTESVV